MTPVRRGEIFLSWFFFQVIVGEPARAVGRVPVPGGVRHDPVRGQYEGLLSVISDQQMALQSDHQMTSK